MGWGQIHLGWFPGFLAWKTLWMVMPLTVRFTTAFHVTKSSQFSVLLFCEPWATTFGMLLTCSSFDSRIPVSMFLSYLTGCSFSVSFASSSLSPQPLNTGVTQGSSHFALTYKSLLQFHPILGLSTSSMLTRPLYIIYADEPSKCVTLVSTFPLNSKFIYLFAYSLFPTWMCNGISS